MAFTVETAREVWGIGCVRIGFAKDNCFQFGVKETWRLEGMALAQNGTNCSCDTLGLVDSNFKCGCCASCITLAGSGSEI